MSDDGLVELAFTQMRSENSPWFANLLSFLDSHDFQGLLTDAPFSVASAVEEFRKHWYDGVCLSPATKVSFFMDTMHFDSKDHDMASYLGELHP